jgi:hypothetical protein
MTMGVRFGSAVFNLTTVLSRRICKQTLRMLGTGWAVNPQTYVVVHCHMTGQTMHDWNQAAANQSWACYTTGSGCPWFLPQPGCLRGAGFGRSNLGNYGVVGPRPGISIWLVENLHTHESNRWSSGPSV